MAQSPGPSRQPCAAVKGQRERTLSAWLVSVLAGSGQRWVVGSRTPLISCCSPQVDAAGVGQEPLTGEALLMLFPS